VTQRLVVDPGAASSRLDVYLAQTLGRSRSSVAADIKAGRVEVNNQLARASLELAAGDTVSIDATEAEATPTAAAPKLPIVYQDDDLVVIDKPAGIAVHAGTGQPDAGTVADFARSLTTDPDPERPGLVHRLDKDTSGLLLIARTPESKKALQKLFHDHAIDKTYHLLVTGRVTPEAAVIDLPTDRDPAQPTRRAVLASGRPSVTRYETLATYPGYTYLEAKPKTGRTHQLRVHFAQIGHPVAGDTVYGPPTRPLGLTRQFLHAAALAFTTPSGKPLSLTSPLPPELQRVINQLESEAAA
jgi:23S rRNA pseudouridine1911/1915/1917 synthase